MVVFEARAWAKEQRKGSGRRERGRGKVRQGGCSWERLEEVGGGGEGGGRVRGEGDGGDRGRVEEERKRDSRLSVLLDWCRHYNGHDGQVKTGPPSPSPVSQAPISLPSSLRLLICLAIIVVPPVSLSSLLHLLLFLLLIAVIF